MACDCLPGRVQAAFKRAPATSLSSTATTSPDAPGLDWEKVKPEDKTLVHQVSTSVTATASLQMDASSHIQHGSCMSPGALDGVLLCPSCGLSNDRWSGCVSEWMKG